MTATQSETLILAGFLLVSLVPGRGHGEDGSAEKVNKDDGWVRERDPQTGITVSTKTMTLYPRAEPKPALKYRFLPDSFSAVEGNAAIFYLKASGFLEQNAARQALNKFVEDSMAKARKEGKDSNNVPPYVWLSTPPDALPLKEVKEYLQFTSFQQPFLREAAARERFDMDRNFKDVDNPIAYLLPEIQNLREVARTQSLRCRVAIAEDRLDDAIEIAGQQFALARHLGQDDFLVSNLVGMAIASIAWNDLLYLVQHRDAPNLYWALAVMPTPLVSLRRSMSVERQFLYQQFKVLKEVDATPRPPGYWQDFITRIIQQAGMLAGDLNVKLPSGIDDSKSTRAVAAAYIALAYPGAKEYLINELKLPRKQVESYATAQVVFLAVARFYDQWWDETFKWTYLPFWQSRAKSAPSEVAQAMREAGDRYGWIAMPTQMLLPAVRAAKTAEANGDQHIALVQTVEAIRLYAAAHDGQLPPSLDVLPVPAPIDPYTGKPLDYERIDSRAIINGHARRGMRYRLILRMAK